MKKRNLIPLWYNFARVYEIAKLGNYSVRVIFENEYIEGFDDYKAIKKFYSGIQFSSTGQMVVEISKPDYDSTIRGETLSDIHTRISEAKKFAIPEYVKTGAIASLVKTATERLNLSMENIENAEAIAVTIARLALSNEVRIEHIAEAIQYRAVDETCIDAEGKAMQFGKNITIGRGLKNPTEIEEAISFLEKMIVPFLLSLA